MFAGGEIQITQFPSELLDFVRSDKSAEGAEITLDEVCALEAAADGYQNGGFHVPNRERDDYEMAAVGQIRALIKERGPSCINTYKSRSYSDDLDKNHSILIGGTGMSGMGVGVLITAVLSNASPLIVFGVLLAGSGGYLIHDSDKQTRPAYFPSTISKPDDNDDVDTSGW